MFDFEKSYSIALTSIGPPYELGCGKIDMPDTDGRCSVCGISSNVGDNGRKNTGEVSCEELTFVVRVEGYALNPWVRFGS